MPNPRNLAMFILTNGRPDNIKTIPTLRRCGWSGPIYLICDNEDPTLPQYQEKYGDMVQVFDKLEAATRVDTADQNENRNAVVFARNSTDAIADALGLDYYMQLDDDYTSFEWRYQDGEKLGVTSISDLDALMQSLVAFLEASGAKTVALAQGGDFIGGVNGSLWRKGLVRKAMNSFLVRTGDPINFVGRINEDTNTYVTEGNRGQLYFTITEASLVQTQTQASQGGLTGIYLELGTYTKSFYTVMMAPSCAKVGAMGGTAMRMHHRVSWQHAVPQILSEKYRKPRN